jgi:hypothetical protein
MASLPRRLMFGSTQRTAWRSTRLLDIRRYCAGGIRGPKCNVSKATGCCSESNLTPSTQCTGVTETENAAGEEFGYQQLERVVRDNRLQPASELSRQVLSELQRWRPAAVNQQDDITLIVVDVL